MRVIQQPQVLDLSRDTRTELQVLYSGFGEVFEGDLLVRESMDSHCVGRVMIGDISASEIDFAYTLHSQKTPRRGFSRPCTRPTACDCRIAPPRSP